jgi:hypothetical protein
MKASEIGKELIAGTQVLWEKSMIFDVHSEGARDELPWLTRTSR